MTASNPMLHGSDLDECCSNVFALTDLCGLKWRKYVFNQSSGTIPSEDPVLKSFSLALTHDILCAWRRSPLTTCQSNLDTNCISIAKELWVFWFGEDPSLQGIVSAELKVLGHGCWEDGLPHEPRSLLFKALHNLLERCMLSRKFVRLGKWFTKPCEDREDLNSSNHLSFSFSFFVHGESSVCTAVEIQQQQRVRHLTLEDIAVAASKQEGLPVLLGPYGLSGSITGQTSHLDEMVSVKLIEEWKKFYPLDSSSDWSEAVSHCSNKGIPAATLVVVGETQMWYPSMFVVVPYTECGKADESVLLRCDPATNSGPTSLTPPASPLDSNNADVVTGCANLLPMSKVLPSAVSDKKTLTHSLVQEVWQEITKPASNKSASQSSMSRLTTSFMKTESSNDVTSIGQWDFEDPFKRTSCSCTSSSNISRPKAPTQVRPSFGITRPIPSPSYPSQSPQQQQQISQTTQSSAKLKKEKKKPLVPFHHRLSVEKDRPEAIKSHVGAMTKGLPTANLLTSINQKRHPDVALGHNTKRYSLQNPAISLHNSSSTAGHKTPLTNIKSEVKVPQPCASLLKAETSAILSKSFGCGQDNVLVKTEESYPADFPGKKDVDMGHEKEHNHYILPEESVFVVPVLPSDPLDCRTGNDLEVPTDVLSPLPLEPALPVWESGKRPSTDAGFENVFSPAKRRRESSTGRARSDSSGGGRPRGRRNSSQPSPVTTPLSDPFTPQPDEQDIEMTQPPIKSPTQGRITGSKPRRRGSNAPVESPSMTQSSDASNKLPAKIKNRRQSSRKKQQESNERLNKGSEEMKPHQSKTEKGSYPSFSSSDDEPEPTPRTSNLMTEQDLAVTVNDLDKLFDSDEEEDESGQGKSVKIDFGSHVNPFDSITSINSHHTITNAGVVAQQDLARMFPTPPSLEPVSHSPPCSVGTDYISPGSVKTTVHSSLLSPETAQNYLMSYTGMDTDQEKQLSPVELGPVFEMPQHQDFPVSYSFEAVEGLPSSKALPSALQYLPSWQVPQKSWTLSVTKLESNSDVLNCDLAAAVSSPAAGYTYTHPASVSNDVKQLTSAAMSPASPASSASSFSLPVQFAKHFQGSGAVAKPLFQSPLPEVNSISKVLMLSDSNMNYFSDKNYDSVSLCSCLKSLENGQTKGTSTKNREFERCSCGFGPLEGMKFSVGTGLFPDDVYSTSLIESTKQVVKKEVVAKSVIEIKKEPGTSLAVNRRRSSAAISVVLPSVPFCLLEEIASQCSSPFSCSNLKYQLMYKGHHGSMKQQVLGGLLPQKGTAESGYLQSVPQSVAVSALNCLRQLMQDALQKSTSRKTWEQPNGTVVQGPLSWKQLHHLATKGNEETPRAQPIPSVTVGYSGDWMSLSPIALQFWEKLLLEPYSCQRDVAYVVVAPENDLVLSNVKMFFKEFSAVYETCRLGQHVAITKVLRDGILRIGQNKSLKLAKEAVDDWFTNQAGSHDGAKLKLYAQAFKHHLGPYLASLNLDKLLPESEKGENPDDKVSSKFGGDSSGNSSAGTPSSEQAPSPFGEDDSERNSDEPPTVVVYIVNPFSGNSREDSFPSYVGLLRCIAEISPDITEGKKNVIFQIVPIQQILQVDTLIGSRETAMSFVTQLKCLAFSVFSRCRKSLQLNINAKSLTGFGPAARHEALFRQREMENAKVYSAPYVLSQPIPVPPGDCDDSSSLQALSQNASFLYCGYCLSHDDKYILAVCTDGVGELLESSIVSVESPLRPDGRPRKTAARTKALFKLWEFCQGVMATSLVPWRLVISKLGKIGPEELKDWKEILSKTSVLAGDQMFKDTCKTCFSMKQKNRPTILGTSLTSFEPEPSIRLYMARALPKVNILFDGKSNSRVSVGGVPRPDVSRTYIAVMPVASLKCSIGKLSNAKPHEPPDATTETVVTDTDILLAGVDDDENDNDPLGHLFPLINTLPPALSPSSCMLPSPLDASPMQGTSPLTRPGKLTSSPGMSVSSPFQPISRISPFQPLRSTPSPSLGSSTMLETENAAGDDCLPVPQAQGYLISTVHTGKMPATFWGSSSHSETSDPVILKAALHIHNPDLMEGMKGVCTAWHALATKSPCLVLRSILQTYDALSWLTVDPVSRDRRSCLPVHLYMLCQLHDTLSVLLDNECS
ncbi:mediator of RNA polymerase II transcription subunit 13-like isoform X2 [Acropora millepora]|uniref:mediator of RNA polymerase II transcription subunit 13-like isoform X2 n=1 Tax=Acropora millepora TaxID=45264 RepID=UPI001CF3E3A0|nr:mediator of RNA polymerase II transcription subunit 13-like isoform X2 [Acropora millepora]